MNRVPATTVPVSPAAAPPQEPPPLPGPKPGRPISAALSRTLDILTQNSSVTPAELATALSVSPSYARTLLRRARARQPERFTALRPVSPDIAHTFAELNMRLSETENSLAALRNAGLQNRLALSLNRRAEVLRLAESGEAVPDIARKLAMPHGEAEFILKIDRLLASAALSR